MVCINQDRWTGKKGGHTSIDSFALVILDSNYNSCDFHRSTWDATQPVKIIIYR